MKTQMSANKARDLLEILIPNLKELKSLKEELVKIATEKHHEILNNRSGFSKFWNSEPNRYERRLIVLRELKDRTKVLSWSGSYINNILFLLGITHENDEYDSICKDIEELEKLAKQLNSCALIGDPIYLTGNEANVIAQYL